MWTCQNCRRIFRSAHQPHSCKRVSVDSHFLHKEKARRIFEVVLDRIGHTVGPCQIVSLPCCVHLFGTYDFLAALPKRDGLEIRFALDRPLKTPRLKISVPMSKHVHKNCFDITDTGDIDTEFMDWIRESYHLKD